MFLKVHVDAIPLHPDQSVQRLQCQKGGRNVLECVEGFNTFPTSQVPLKSHSKWPSYRQMNELLYQDEEMVIQKQTCHFTSMSFNSVAIVILQIFCSVLMYVHRHMQYMLKSSFSEYYLRNYCDNNIIFMEWSHSVISLNLGLET